MRRVGSARSCSVARRDTRFLRGRWGTRYLRVRWEFVRGRGLEIPRKGQVAGKEWWWVGGVGEGSSDKMLW